MDYLVSCSNRRAGIIQNPTGIRLFAQRRPASDPQPKTVR